MDNQTTPQTGSKKYGPVMGIIIIVALLIAGGLYLASMEFTERSEPDPETEELKQQGSSDDLESIESDLNATNFNSIDEGTAEFEAELQVQ